MCSSGGAATVTMDSGSPRGSGDALHGLKFGHKIYFEDSGGGGNGSSSKPPPSPEKGVAAPLPAPARKAKGVAPGGQPPPPPRCQVEGCNAELTGAKPYYCRHKVCCMHSKAPKVVVAGQEQRFCQQCSRFHQLPEFDQGKRSCRRRLAGHNERRRKPSLGPFAARHDHLASSFHEEPSRFRSFMMDFSFPNFTNRGRYFWSTSRAGDQVAAGEWQGSLDAPPLTAAASTALHGAQPYFRGSLTGTFRAPIEFPPVESLTRVSDSSCALSLLSTHAWSGSSAGDHAPVAPASRSFDGPPITHSGIGRDYATSSWGFGAQGGQTSSFDIQHHEATETSGAHFSGQLEFSTHDNEACVDHNSGGAYDHDDPSMHWSL